MIMPFIFSSLLIGGNMRASYIQFRLYSFNFFVLRNRITKLLNEGVNVVLDRYAYSGVAFSAAKGLSQPWCISSDVGLPEPDVVFFLDIPPVAVASRSNFGVERYERTDFLERVRDEFLVLRNEKFCVVDATQPVEMMHTYIMQTAEEVISSCGYNPLKPLWMRDETVLE